MKKLALITRILLGLIFLIFGLNGFLQFVPPPPSMPEPALHFIGALMQSGYLMSFVKSIEVLTGLMLLGNFQVPLALLLLSPIVVNIFLFHFFLTGPMTALGNIPMVLVLLMIIQAWDRRKNFRPLFHN